MEPVERYSLEAGYRRRPVARTSVASGSPPLIVIDNYPSLTLAVEQERHLDSIVVVGVVFVVHIAVEGGHEGLRAVVKDTAADPGEPAVVGIEVEVETEPGRVETVLVLDCTH